MKSKRHQPERKQASTGMGLQTFKNYGTTVGLEERSREFATFIEHLKANQLYSYYRPVASPAGREVQVQDPHTGELRSMLMFASNNYLGLANHPCVRMRVKQTIDEMGVGVGGPPLLNGYTVLMQQLEQRLARLKHQEDAMIFSSGFATNLGLVSGLSQRGDVILYDTLSHASLYDALQLTKAQAVRFEHNSTQDLERKLHKYQDVAGNLFVAVEGVYSMDGDLAPLDRIIDLCRHYGAQCWLDDAHGTGILGAGGSGTADHFGLAGAIDVSMGTFSKVFSVTGGFLAGSREMINYLRYYARSYLFSAALPPITLAAVMAGLDVIENEPVLREKLMANVAYARAKLRPLGFQVEPEAAIIALKVPEGMDIRRANGKIHRRGIFLNAIEYPAVPLQQERFRISLMAEHTTADIDFLTDALQAVWKDEEVYA